MDGQTAKMQPFFLSASLICADILSLREEIAKLEDGQADYIHFDVMDGVFVPRFGMYPEILRAVRSITSIPFDVHLMLANPEPYISLFAEAGAQIIAVHAEGNHHLQRTISLIHKCGAKAGIVLNPATGLDVLDYIMEDLDLILIMAINPGIVGHPLWPGALGKIADLGRKLGDRSSPIIEVDGGVTFQSAPSMVKAGADMLVCGSSTIFTPNGKVAENLKRLRQVIIDSEIVS